jgi:uncharacterized membrane protein
VDERGEQPADDRSAGTRDKAEETAGVVSPTQEPVFADTELVAVRAQIPEKTELARSASLNPTERVIPTWTDPTVRRASEVIGGPLGRHAIVGRALWLTPLRVCLLMAILILIFGWLFKSPCIQQGPNGAGGVTLDQSGERPWITGCYNDVVPLYGSHKLDTQAMPYKTSWVDADGSTHYMEYPVITGYFMWGVSELGKYYVEFAGNVGLPVPLDVAAYFTIGAIILVLFYLWAVASTARIARRRVWDVAIMCLSPLLIVHAFTNWDLLAIGMTAGAMAAWARGRPVLAGALIGLGAAAKLYPVLLLGPLLLLAVRSGRWQGLVRTTVAAAVVWLVVNVPVMYLYPVGWYEFIKLNSERPAEYDSWYAIYTSLSTSHIFDTAAGADSPTFLNVLSLALFGVACAAIAWFALAVKRRPRLAQLIFLVVAAFLLTNKVWSPQYSLWLLPLVVLALPRWRPVLVWQFSEAVVWMLLMFYFDGVTNKGLSIYPFIAAAIVRDALLIALIVRVIMEIMRPMNDLVRMAGDDDPSGGVFEGVPDRFVLRSLPALLRDRRPTGDQSRSREPVLVGGGSGSQPPDPPQISLVKTTR